MTGPFATVRLRWLSAAEGGRSTPFTGPRYAATARFPGDPELFSVILAFAEDSKPNPGLAQLRLLNPDLCDIKERMLAGSRLEITEGPRTVADCQIESD